MDCSANIELLNQTPHKQLCQGNHPGAETGLGRTVRKLIALSSM